MRSAAVAAVLLALLALSATTTTARGAELASKLSEGTNGNNAKRLLASMGSATDGPAIGMSQVSRKLMSAKGSGSPSRCMLAAAGTTRVSCNGGLYFACCYSDTGKCHTLGGAGGSGQRCPRPATRLGCCPF